MCWQLLSLRVMDIEELEPGSDVSHGFGSRFQGAGVEALRVGSELVPFQVCALITSDLAFLPQRKAALKQKCLEQVLAVDCVTGQL